MKKLKHIWTILCKKSVIDNETNNLSLYEVLERLQVKIGELGQSEKVPSTITIPFSFEIISFLVRNNLEDKSRIDAETRLQVYDPSGKVMGEMKRPFMVAPEIRRMRVRLRSSSLGITMPGLYRFVVSVKEAGHGEFEILSEIPLEVEISKDLLVKTDNKNKN